MNWLLAKLARLLIGDGLDMTDERMDGITLAIQEEAERLGLCGPCA